MSDLDLLAVDTIYFEKGFALTKRLISAWGSMRMAAALAWSRTALAALILALLAQNTPLPMWTISDTVGSFQPGGAFAGQ